MAKHVWRVRGDMILKEDEYSELWEWCRNYIDKNCIWRASDSVPHLSSKDPNKNVTAQFYLGRGLYNVNFVSAISQLLLHNIIEEYKSFDFQIAGLETGSTPLLTSIPLIAKVYGIEINAFSIKKLKKPYGLFNQIEGLTSDKPVLLIDDICSTTTSLRSAFDTLVHHNCPKILDTPFVVVIDKTEADKAKTASDNHNLLPPHMNVGSLFAFEDFNLSPHFSDVQFEEQIKEHA